MSGLWNPYAFSPTGEAVASTAPPALRVIGGKATAAQLSAAQAAFANFCMHARLSSIPNPTEQGRLGDGSVYRIVTLGGTTIMELSPVGVGELVKNVFSGILMEFGTGKEPVVLINEGKTDAPGPQWRIDKVPANIQIPVGGVAEPVGYNSWAWVEVARVLRGKAKYVCTDTLRQYARRVGYVVPAMFSPTGVDDKGRILALAKIGNSIHTARTAEKATDTGWYGLDDLPDQLPLFYFGDDGPIFTADEGELIGNITASRSSNKISFTVAKHDYFTPEDFSPDRTLTVYRVVPFYARAGVTILGEVFISNAAAGVGIDARVYMRRGYELDMYTSTLGPDGFLPASVEWSLPANVIDPPQETIGWVDSINNRVFFYFPERTSIRITGLTKPKFDIDGNGGGPYGYRSSRAEDTHSLIGLNYVGHELLTRVVVSRKFRHEQSQDGTYSAQWSGDSVGTITADATTSTFTETQEYVELANTRLYLKRDTYQASSTYSKTEHRTVEEYPDEGVFRVVESTVLTSMTYTARREQRYLYVYDPSLDLVCYSEATFDTSWGGDAETYSRGRDFGGYPPDAYRTSLSAGPDFPPGVPLCFVVKCRGAETRVTVPQSYVEELTDVERKLFYASFFPNSGVAPTTPPNAAVRTSTGFEHHPVDALSPLSPDTPDYINNDVIYIPGMFPEIHPPGNIRVLYRKTPETGGGVLDISSEKGEFSRRFLIDLTGARYADSVVSNLPPTPWNNVSTF